MDTKRGRLIGLYAPMAGSGKSEVAKTLAFLGRYQTVKFADPLKAMTRAFLSTLGFDPTTVERMVEGDLKEEVVPGLFATPRRLMQTLGTDWGRVALRDSLWVDLARKRINDRLDRGDNVVVDDLRFPNEHAALRAMGATLVRIHRPLPSCEGGTPGYEGLLEHHPFDVRIENAGSLDDLWEKTVGLL